MIAPLELQDLASLRVCPRKADRRHRRLRARVYEPDHLQRRHCLADLLREKEFRLARGTETRSIFERLDDLSEHDFARMTKNQGAPGTDVVCQPVTVCVPYLGPPAFGYEEGFSA